MQLLPCNRPIGSLESAPRTSLCADSEHERWDGFWCVADEGYYARCRLAGGSEQWFRVVDERAKGILRFPSVRRTSERRMVFLSSKVAGRSILIGTSRRRPRSSRGAEGSR